MRLNSIEEKTLFTRLLDSLQKYAYVETFAIFALFFGIRYLINPQDICMLDSKASVLMILLAVITLFHGFENGFLSLGIISTVMWYFYPIFPYLDFLMLLMMALIFSEFHYYWTQKIKAAEIQSSYKSVKLDELSKAFYTLKISHDQLEKNYVIKPMSIRNSIEKIVTLNKESSDIQNIDENNKRYYENFLTMLAKSFSVVSARVVYLNHETQKQEFTATNALIAKRSSAKNDTIEDLLADTLVDKALTKKQPIYVSDDLGVPMQRGDATNFLAVIPSVIEEKVISLLIIDEMPFMSFNKENLTSIAILLEYFSLEILQKNTLDMRDDIAIVKDDKFRYEYSRMQHLYKKFHVNSILLVLRIDNELQALRIYEKIRKMLRSLDLVTLVEYEGLYYVTLFFPLHDKSAALGYLNRLNNSLDEAKDKNFNYMTFDMKQTELFNKYIKEDYNG